MWYYADNGERRGPVTDADFQTLCQAGTIGPETLVWRDGMAGWQPCREVVPGIGARPAVPPTIGIAPAAAGELPCAECGKSFAPDQVIRLNDRWVCAGCKPIFLQRLREGSFAGLGATSGMVSEAQVRERDYEHSIGTYFSQAWALFKSAPGIIIGVTVLVGFCFAAANVIPYLSVVTSIILSGPLLGGLFAFFLKKLRGQDATVGDGFSGFGPRFGQLLLGHFVPGLLAWVALIPAVVLAGIVMFAGLATRSGSGGGSASALMLGVPLIICGILGLAAVCVMIYLGYCWFFTLWLVMDKKMTFWPAMSLSRAVVRKHWWQTFWLGVVSVLVVVVGFLALVVGVIVAAPVAVAMWAYAYERLFGDMQPAAD